ncbi:hypothetical protein [Clostridium perfringens]|uniref:hypothetical protein n=1 Tax=Clostridium perfringens TaxID=1502 RepID=UPI001FAC8CC9|nr:hypothetical protein [Clostridium perfringens]
MVAGISSVQRIEEILKISKNRKISFMHQAAWVNSRNGVSVPRRKDKNAILNVFKKNEWR